jgi:hypothetical protein
VLNGTVDRHPRAGIILANAGGFVPYASYRSTELARVFRSDAAKPADCLGPLLAAQISAGRPANCHANIAANKRNTEKKSPNALKKSQ